MTSTINRFTTLRENAGLNKSQLAQRLGVGVNFVCQIESGGSPIPASRISALAEAFNVTEDEITLLRGDLPDDVWDAFERRGMLLVDLIRVLRDVADYEVQIMINYIANKNEH